MRPLAASRLNQSGDLLKKIVIEQVAGTLAVHQASQVKNVIGMDNKEV